MARTTSSKLATACLLAALVTACPRRAEAEYAENLMFRSMAAAFFVGFGHAAVGFDAANVIYLTGGVDHRVGRLITGIGSTTMGIGLIIPSALLLGEFDEKYIPYGCDSCEEERAMDEGRVLCVTGIGLGVTSIGLGIAALATYGQADRSEESTLGLYDVKLLPLPSISPGAAGGGAMLTGRF